MWQALFLLGTLKHVDSMGLPNYIEACSRNDPKLNDCALRVAKKSLHQFSLGDKSRGMHPLDPVYVAEMTVFIPNENGLKLMFKDNHFSGLSEMQLQSLRFNLDKKLITVDALVNLDVKNVYDLSGKILMLSITSSGDSSITLKNTTLHIHIWYEHVIGDDGRIYWKITKHDIKYEVERAYFRLENFLKDKNIGDRINKLLNELWKDIIAEVGPSICDSLGNAVVDNVAVLLEQVPYDELMPE